VTRRASLRTGEVPVQSTGVRDPGAQRTVRGRGADAVLDDGRRLEADPPSPPAEPVAQVDVLDEQVVAGIEATDRLEVAAPDRERAAGDPVDVAGLGSASGPVRSRAW
jgi:hypothetical protein